MIDFYRPLCRHLVFPLWARWEGSTYLSQLEHLEKSQYLSLADQADMQWRRVREMLAHAYGQTRFYRQVLDGVGVRPEDIRNFDDYLRVPLLRKVDVQNRAAEMMAQNVRPHFSFMTSGSTGRPVRGYWSKESNDIKRACGMRSNFWAGYSLGGRIYCLYGDPERELSGLRRLKARLRRRMLMRTEILDMLTLSEGTMLAFARKMMRRPPVLLWGHAHGLYLLARFLDKNGIESIRPRGMYSAGMVLHDFERRAVERVFGCELQDRYGCEEFGLIAAECKAREGLHINTDDLYVELIGADGRHVAAGERGAIVVTDLSNKAMPFLRYRMEDVGIPSGRQCSCGRTQPLIGRIEGRVADFLLSPDGQIVSGISLTDHFAGHIPGVAQMQIVQEELDCLVLRVVRGEGYGADSVQQVEALVRDFFGDKMRCRFDYVQQIDKGPTGKFRFTICTVKHDLL